MYFGFVVQSKTRLPRSFFIPVTPFGRLFAGVECTVEQVAMVRGHFLFLICQWY